MFKEGDLIQHKENKRIRMYGSKDNERIKNQEDYVKLHITIEDVFKEGTLVCYRHDRYENEKGATSIKTMNFDNNRYYINHEYIERLETWEPLVDEWCIYEEDAGVYVVSQFVKSEFDTFYEKWFYEFKSGDKLLFESFKPFIGELPDFKEML